MVDSEFSGSPKDTIETEEVKPKPKSRRSTRKPPGTRKKAAPASARVTKIVLRSLWPSKLIILEGSMPSGTRYEFPAGGSTLQVEPEDAPVLLARRRKAGCCGAGIAEQPFFEQVGG
jgi:hypothetical protein